MTNSKSKKRPRFIKENISHGHENVTDKATTFNAPIKTMTLSPLESQMLRSLEAKYGNDLRYSPKALALALFNQSINESNPFGDPNYADILTILFNPENQLILDDYFKSQGLKNMSDKELQEFLKKSGDSVRSVIELAKNQENE